MLSRIAIRSKVVLHPRCFSSLPLDPPHSSDPISTDPPKLTPPSTIALKPKEVVSHLDKYIVGQNDAKRAVAVAFRNRWRRTQLPPDMKNEVIPKNILMIGPTGCGKTEIARRIAKLCDAPFIKVEATKFTEVGYHGRDVDMIIRDLVDNSIAMTKKRLAEQAKQAVAEKVEERILEALLTSHAEPNELEAFRDLLRNGHIEDRIIEVDIKPLESKNNDNPSVALTNEVLKIINIRNSKPPKGSDRKRVTIAEARGLLEESETEKILSQYDVVKEAIQAVEENGIVFIDEIDKIVSTNSYRGGDASAEGVQRDLLPIIEGSIVNTKHGNVNTEFILFIASGAFHSSKPSDLLAELQGRLPIRVNLKGLEEADLYRILTEPVTNLIRQQEALMHTEKVALKFSDCAVKEIAKIAHEVNRSVENIGARRLHTILEKVVEEISFSAPDHEGENVNIDAAYVQQRVAEFLKATDLKRYIL